MRELAEYRMVAVIATTTTDAPTTTTTVVATTTTEAPPPPPPTTAPPPPPTPAPPAGGGWSADWDAIAACESGGNWSINTGNGYYGGLQMDMTFWSSYGGAEFASRPDLASKSQQITVAERAYRSGRGTSPWPVCGSRG